MWACSYYLLTEAWQRATVGAIGNQPGAGLRPVSALLLILSHSFTVVYIDSVGVIEPVGKYGFALYAELLDSALSKRLIKAIKSIKLKRLE
jgi:hypothetical protein